MDRHQRSVRYTVDSVYLILSIIAYVYMLRDYKGLRHDPDVKYEPWYYIMTWSSIGIVTAALSTFSMIRSKSLLQLGVIATWIWGWIIISDDSVLKHQYHPVWRLTLAFQICAIFFEFFYAYDLTRTRSASASSSASSAA